MKLKALIIALIMIITLLATSCINQEYELVTIDCKILSIEHKYIGSSKCDVYLSDGRILGIYDIPHLPLNEQYQLTLKSYYNGHHYDFVSVNSD